MSQAAFDTDPRAATAGRAVPLAGHQAFHVRSSDSLCAAVESRLAARCLALPARTPFDAWANHYRLPSGEFWYCAYDQPVTLEFPEGDYLRVQIPFAGMAITRCANRSTTVTGSQGCISSAVARIEFGAGYQQLVWRVRRDLLSRKLTALTGDPVTRRLEFQQTLPLDAPGTRVMTNILHCILANIATAPAATLPWTLTELEQILIVALITGTDHTHRAALARDMRPASPWYVRRVEEYIEANWDKPFDIEDAAVLTGTSARAIYRAFRKTRGYSPLAFSKQRRLSRAREMLGDASSARTVLEVATACGFGDISHFSRDFSKAFGEPPSAVLAKARR